MNSEEIKKDVEHKKKAIENKGKSITYEEFIEKLDPLATNGDGIPDKYSDYSYTIDNGENIYFKWTKKADKKIKKGFKWNKIFDVPEPIEWHSSKVQTGETEQVDVRALSIDKDYVEKPIIKDSGYVKPKFRFIGMQLSGIRDHKKEYKEALEHFDLEENEKVSPDTVSSITNYKESLYNQLQRQITKIKEIDREIERILKVFYYETEQETIKGGASDYSDEEAGRRAKAWQKHIQAVRHLYFIISTGADVERISKHRAFNNNFTDDKILKSTLYGITKLVNEKQPYLEVAAKIARRIRPLERLQEDAILHRKTTTGEIYQNELNSNFCRTTAKEFRKGAKNKEYSVDAIAFAMEVALQHKDETNMSKLARIVKGEEKDKNETKLTPPDEINEGTNRDTIVNWIDHFDSRAGIERTK